MTTLERLYTEYGQSPWLDNVTRGYLRDGTIAHSRLSFPEERTRIPAGGDG
jgi:hypothetical protein